jgi:hypothetical protein
MIFSELRGYAEAKLAPDVWNTVLKQAGLEQSVYLPIREYPDAEALALVTALSTLTRRSVSLILEDVDEFSRPRPDDEDARSSASARGENDRYHYH